MAAASESSKPKDSKKKSKFSLRQTFECPIFGPPTDFGRLLPTYDAVIRRCGYERRELALLAADGNKEPTFSEIAHNVASKLISLYEEASIPTLSKQRVVTMIQSYHAKYISIKDVVKRIEKSETVKTKVEKFKEEAQVLFDIAACKCADFKLCSCSKEKKVPAKEQQFLTDQRSARRMAIGTVDIQETLKLKKRTERKEHLSKRLRKTSITESTSEYTETVESVDDVEDAAASDRGGESDDSSEDYVPSTTGPSSSASRVQSQMRLPLENTALISQRYGISDRATAAIASSVLKDVGLITETNTCLVTDKCKISREG